MLYHQTENVNKEVNIIKKNKDCFKKNSGVEK